jgi:hypothetical protein
MVGTTVYSTIYYGLAVVIVLMSIRSIYRVWKPYVVTVDQALENNIQAPSLFNPIVKTVAIFVALIVILVLGWNLKQRYATGLSTYQTPAEQSEQKKVEESQLPTQQQMDQKRAEQKEKTDVKPQKDAIDSFNQDMQKEADKIKERNK